MRKAQVKLAAYSLDQGETVKARTIADDMSDEPHERLVTIRAQLEGVTTKDFWEIIDRGRNFEYMPDSQRAKMDVFFNWLHIEKSDPSVAPPPPLAQQRPAPDPDAGLSHDERRRRANRRKALPKRRDELLAQVEKTEARKAEIEAKYCEPGFFEQTPEAQVAKLKREQMEIESRLDRLVTEWEGVEAELAELGLS